MSGSCHDGIRRFHKNAKTIDVDILLTWGLEKTGKLAFTFKNSTMVQHHIKGTFILHIYFMINKYLTLNILSIVTESKYKRDVELGVCRLYDF